MGVSGRGQCFPYKALTFLDVNGVAEGMNDDEFDDGVDGNCGEFVADIYIYFIQFSVCTQSSNI